MHNFLLTSPRVVRFLLPVALLSVDVRSAAPVPGRAVNFQREVRPLLAENCFQCHGPDSTTRMAGLRLDLKDAAMETRRTGTVIVPGKPDASLLYQRITASTP